MLHAFALRFRHPESGADVAFSSADPRRLRVGPPTTCGALTLPARAAALASGSTVQSLPALRLHCAHPLPARSRGCGRRPALEASTASGREPTSSHRLRARPLGGTATTRDSRAIYSAHLGRVIGRLRDGLHESGALRAACASPASAALTLRRPRLEDDGSRHVTSRARRPAPSGPPRRFRAAPRRPSPRTCRASRSASSPPTASAPRRRSPRSSTRSWLPRSSSPSPWIPESRAGRVQSGRQFHFYSILLSAFRSLFEGIGMPSISPSKQSEPSATPWTANLA